MLRPRIIPSLLVHKKGLVKTEEFKQSKYVGDPINAVKIFNEKEVDELIVLDIDATIENRGPDFQMIKNLAVECRMPFCYGGGVSTVDEAKKIVKLGAEKVAFSYAAINNVSLLKQVGANVTKAGKISAKKGFKTDLASVPRIGWAFIAPFDIARSAVIHDALYSAIRDYRVKNGYAVGSNGSDETKESRDVSAQAKQVADKVFLEAMMESDPKVASWKAYASYYSVVLFGRWSVIPR